MSNKKPDQKKVEDLKEKARQSSGSSAPDIMFGPGQENQRAAGTGEFDA